jgi:hypothetical protein
VAFTGTGQTLKLESDISGGTIANFRLGNATAGNTIDLPNVTYSADNVAVYDPIGGALYLIPDIVGETVEATLTLQPNLGLHVTTQSDGHGGTDLISAPPCFASGTRIATPGGERAVQSLRPGDVVLALGGARTSPRPVRWVGHVTIELARHPSPDAAAPVRIRADAFAPGVPRRDVMLSPDHAVLWEGALIHAADLVNGATILRTYPRRITYWHVELDTHAAILLADGLPAESYLDLGNRALFAGERGARALHPLLTGPAGWDARACAPLLVGEEYVRPARDALARRAESLGWRQAGGRWHAPGAAVARSTRAWGGTARGGRVEPRESRAQTRS